MASPTGSEIVIVHGVSPRTTESQHELYQSTDMVSPRTTESQHELYQSTDMVSLTSSETQTTTDEKQTTTHSWPPDLFV